MKRPNQIAVLTLACLMIPAASAQAGHGRGGPFGLLRHDANQDGQLTRAELTNALEAQFAQMDTNGDGSSTAEERKAAREARRAEGRGDRFAALDADGNGQVSEEEFAARPERQGRGPGLRGGRRAGQRGAMAQETITLAAFSERRLAAFDALDADGNQVVSQAELHAAAAKRGAR